MVWYWCCPKHWVLFPKNTQKIQGLQHHDASRQSDQTRYGDTQGDFTTFRFSWTILHSIVWFSPNNYIIKWTLDQMNWCWNFTINCWNSQALGPPKIRFTHFGLNTVPCRCSHTFSWCYRQRQFQGRPITEWCDLIFEETYLRQGAISKPFTGFD